MDENNEKNNREDKYDDLLNDLFHKGIIDESGYFIEKIEDLIKKIRFKFYYYKLILWFPFYFNSKCIKWLTPRFWCFLESWI